MNHVLPPKLLRNPVPILTKDDILHIGGQPYVPAGRRVHGYNFIHQEHPDREIFLTHAAINEHLDRNRAELEYMGATPETQFLQQVLHGKKFDDFSEDVKRIARLREKLFQLYDEECLLKGHINRTTDDFSDWIIPNWKKVVGRTRADSTSNVIPLSPSTFNRRYKEWVHHGRNILAIMPRHNGPGPQRTLDFSAESLDFAVVEAKNFMTRLKLKKGQVFEGYKAAVHKENELRAAENKIALHEFGRTKFYEIIDSFPAFDVVAEREGMDAAFKQFAPNLRIHDETYLGQRLEIDEVKADLATIWAMAGMLGTATEEQWKILKKIRVWIVVIIDVATRYVLAAKVAQAPTAQAAQDTLRLALMDKTWISDLVGAQVPWIGHVLPTGSLYMDHGSAFLSQQVTDTARALKIQVTKPETGKAKGRPHIESLFHTIGPDFTQFYDGRTFRSIEEKGDYDPKEHASLAVGEFSEIVIRSINDMYNIKAHGSLGGQSPHDKYVDTVEGYGYTRPPNQAQMIRAFGRRETLKMGRYGLVKHGIPYSDTELVEQHMDQGQESFEVICDLGHLNHILVKDKNGDWRMVPNRIDLPQDLTEAEWAEVVKEDRAEKRARTAETYPIIRDAILRNRENGKAATLRAKLDPVGPSPAKLEKQRRQLYRNFVVAPATGADISGELPLVPPEDDLRSGKTIPQRPAETKMPTLPEKKVSRFDRRRDDD